MVQRRFSNIIFALKPILKRLGGIDDRIFHTIKPDVELLHFLCGADRIDTIRESAPRLEDLMLLLAHVGLETQPR